MSKETDRIIADLVDVFENNDEEKAKQALIAAAKHVLGRIDEIAAEAKRSSTVRDRIATALEGMNRSRI